MTTISTENQLVTLINIFTVAPEDQGRLVELLAGATEEGMSKLPGYVSANIHASLDGTKVTNYAQWRSVEDYEAAIRNPEARVHMQTAAELAERFEPTLYRVSYTHETR